ncbi:tetratricopeptide repeat protein [Glaciecola petra]|uniref:Tetratricopeptide repeat protein n=1 Tax=Glaciecola petra TaxID=3075602 RepID=A0ABU2ZMN0_9ALTE|nr:tetratricopeptide repeat protein [Aestuariibacter sp. P117]MDT0593880.1 tetratricopeptide repeat protein [Aestuariibacter sp. P117]
MKKFNAIKNTFVSIGMVTLATLTTTVNAQQIPIDCPGYELPKTKLLGERAGKKLNSAYEVYQDPEIEEQARIAQTVEMLGEIEAKEPYDQAYVEQFMGKLMISIDGKMNDAYVVLKRATERNALNDKDQADMLKLMGDLSLQEEKFSEAISWYDKWMEFTCKETPEVYLRSAQANFNIKKYDEAIAQADNSIRVNEEIDKRPYVLKLGAYHETKRYNDAVKVAEILVELLPEEGEWWARLGFLYMLVEDFDSALATMSVAYDQGFLSKKNEIRALAQLYAQKEIPIKSAELQKKYMDTGLLDNGAKDLATLANVYLAARETKEAAKYYGQAGAKDPDPEYFRKQGVMLMQSEDYVSAIGALTKALDNGAEEGKTHYSLMEANFYAGRFRAANVHAKEAIKDPQLRRSARAWLPYIKQKADARGIKL